MILLGILGIISSLWCIVQGTAMFESSKFVRKYSLRHDYANRLMWNGVILIILGYFLAGCSGLIIGSNCSNSLT